MIVREIREWLSRHKDDGYKAFQAPLIPTVPRDAFIGVRTPDLRAYAKELSGRADLSAFLADLPHECFEENQLHAFLISGIKDFESCLRELERFLPFVDNWATCDQMSPRVFGKRHGELRPCLLAWLDSPHPYVVRFAIKMLMDHYLEEDFDPAYPALVAAIRSEEYYVNMMVAWYFATALAKRYEEVLPYFTQGRLSPFAHKKGIRKALESYRVPPERKEYLRTLLSITGRKEENQ